MVLRSAFPSKSETKPMPSINRDSCEITKRVNTEAHLQITEQLVNPLAAELPEVSVEELASDFFRKMRELAGFANEVSIALGARSSEMPSLPPALVPLFKALFLGARLAKASVLDQQRSKTTNPDVIAALDEQLKVYDGVIREEWFQT